MNVTTTKVFNLWTFHPIGTGVIITYNEKTRELKWLSEPTGICFSRESIATPYKNIAEFKKEGIKMYKTLINDNISLTMNYYDDPTIIETATGNVAIDLEILKN